MTTDDLRAVASRILERMIHEHPDEAAVLVTLVLSEILPVGLFDDDRAGVTAFADAVNTKLGEIALARRHRGSSCVRRRRVVTDRLASRPPRRNAGAPLR